MDNQTGIDIHVLQGERELARIAARWLGSRCASPAPAGLPRVEVKFLVQTASCRSARDIRTGERDHRSAAQLRPERCDIERSEESIEYAERDFAGAR